VHRFPTFALTPFDPVRGFAECYEAARILSDPRQKAKLLAMAHSWISLADHAERNSHFEAATTGLTNHGNGPGVVDSAALAMGRKGGSARATA
jgi:hypothetical protein